LNLAERFIAEQGAPQFLEGQRVVQILRLPCKPRDRFVLSMTTPTEQAGQGVQLAVQKGSLRINKQDLVRPVLWEASSPKRVELTVLKGSELRIWNCWRGPQGQTMAWIGNAGIVVREDVGRWRLECSQGPGLPQFDDLLVMVEAG
jgi:hypothetical protein